MFYEFLFWYDFEEVFVVEVFFCFSYEFCIFVWMMIVVWWDCIGGFEGISWNVLWFVFGCFVVFFEIVVIDLGFGGIIVYD